MAGYTRQDTANNIANGNVIDADDFDAEYNAVEAAFNASSGHKHDGTAGEGAPITKVGPSQDLVVSATNVNPKTTNTLDLGVSAGVKFKDGYFQGTLVGETAVKAGTNRYMTLTDNELDVSTGDLILDVEGNIVIDTNGGDITLKDDGTTFGGISNASGQTVIKSGTTPTTAVTFANADATLAGNTTLSGTLDVTGVANFNNSTASTSNTTGAVIVDGGVGIAGAVNIGDDVDIDGDLTVSGVGKNITGNLIGDVKATNGTSVLDSGTDGTDATFTGDVTGNADTATTWATAREIALTGDVTGSVAGVDGSGNISIATTVAANSVALGTDTTGNYMTNVSGGTGVTVTHTPAEGSTATIAIGQAVSTTSNVTFNDVTVSGNLTVSGTTTTVNTETINLADNQIVLNSNETGTPTQNGGIEIERGTAANKTLVWNETDDKWTVGSETFVAATFEGNLTGNLTGDVTGNADTATTLATARTISLTGDVSGSTSFDGSGNVSITATVADDSHNHTISNIDGLQTEIDTKAELAGSASQAFSASTLNATTVDLGDWTITESAGTLYFATGGTNKMKLDASGNLTVTGNVTAYGTV
jgi:hypothetical protein